MRTGQLYSLEEVAAYRDRTFGCASTVTATDNKVTVTIPLAAGQRHFLGSIVLTGTAGDGGAESLTIKHGETVVWEETFVVGTDKVRQFQAVPLVTGFGEALVVEASATALTAGNLHVLFFTK